MLEQDYGSLCFAMVSAPWGSGTVLFQNRDWPSEVMVEYSSVSNMKGETECPKASEML